MATKFSKEFPTTPGWYWIRFLDGEPFVKYLHRHPNGNERLIAFDADDEDRKRAEAEASKKPDLKASKKKNRDPDSGTDVRKLFGPPRKYETGLVEETNESTRYTFCGPVEVPR